MKRATARRPRREARIGLWLVLLVSLLAGCWRPPQPPLRLGLTPWPPYQLFYLAQQKGFIPPDTVTFVDMPAPSDLVRAYEAGTIDGFALTADFALLLLQRDVPTRIVLAEDISLGADALVANRRIRHLRDLRGRRIGVESSTLGHFLLHQALERGGIPIHAVTLVSVDVSRSVDALIAGRVDAIVTYEPYLSRLRAAGGNVLFDSSQIPGQVVDVLMVAPALVDTRTADLRLVARGWFQAVRFARAYPQEVETWIGRQLAMSPADVRRALAGALLLDEADNRRLLSGNPPALLQPLHALAAAIYRYRILPLPIDPLGLPDGRVTGPPDP